MINVKDLHKYFGSPEVLKGINCHIEKENVSVSLVRPVPEEHILTMS